jgi:hypothetical protein
MKKAPFKIGDKVTTSFLEHEEGLVRTVIGISQSSTSESGWAIVADGGEPCPCCGRIGTETRWIDTGWFKLCEGE